MQKKLFFISEFRKKEKNIYKKNSRSYLNFFFVKSS